MVAGLVLGAFVGKSIDTTPRFLGDDLLTPLAGQEVDSPEKTYYAFDDELPNHYPMVTPSGRIEVVELSVYMRNRRNWALMGQYDDFVPLPYDPWPEDEPETTEAFTELTSDYASVPDSTGIVAAPSASGRLALDQAVAIEAGIGSIGTEVRPSKHHTVRINHLPTGEPKLVDIAAPSETARHHQLPDLSPDAAAASAISAPRVLGM